MELTISFQSAIFRIHKGELSLSVQLLKKIVLERSCKQRASLSNDSFPASLMATGRTMKMTTFYLTPW